MYEEPCDEDDDDDEYDEPAYPAESYDDDDEYDPEVCWSLVAFSLLPAYALLCQEYSEPTYGDDDDDDDEYEPETYGGDDDYSEPTYGEEDYSEPSYEVGRGLHPHVHDDANILLSPSPAAARATLVRFSAATRFSR
jgi:hypothetical protein